MIAVDSSVVVAGFAIWHEGHATAAAALARKPRIPAHVLIESFSVLTRLPPPHRAAPDLVALFLAERFKEAPLTLPAREYQGVVHELASSGLGGGATCDVLIAATARHAGATLITRDKRAQATYERMKIAYESLA